MSDSVCKCHFRPILVISVKFCKTALYLVENNFFNDPEKENWKIMDILPLAEHFYLPTDDVQQSMLNGESALIDPTLNTISELNCKTVIIGRVFRAFGEYKCDNVDCGVKCPKGIKRWHSAFSYKTHRQGCSKCKAPVLPAKRSMVSGWSPNVFSKSKSKNHLQDECEMCQCKNKECQLKCTVCSNY